MYSLTVFGLIQRLQKAFEMLAILQYTTFMWPQQATVQDGDHYDFIIVGAGTAGSVIANRLTENPNVEVLLIEAGAEPPMESDIPSWLPFLQHSQYDWSFNTHLNDDPQQCRQTAYYELNQGKMLGGTSSMNYMTYAKGYPIDFSTWARIANDSNWEWRNVLPYYIKSERCHVPEILNTDNNKAFHGTDGYVGVTKEDHTDLLDFMDAFKEIGFKSVVDHNPIHPLGFSHQLLTMADGHRQSSAYAYLSPIKDRPNLHVLKETTVTQIVMEGLRAVGVKAETNEKATITINARKEVIVSAGTFNTPKLLMLSGIGPENHLKEKGINVVVKLPVGENLQSHHSAVIIHTMDKNDAILTPRDPHGYPASVFGGLLALNRNQPYPDYAVNSYVARAETTLQFCSFVYRFKHNICDDIYNYGHDKITVFNEILHLSPKSRGKVLLQSNNPVDSPVIITERFSQSEDLADIVKYIRDITPVTTSKYYRSQNAKLIDPIPSKCQEYSRYSTEFWRCYAQCMSPNMFNFAGTCPMGTVVDGQLKVKGVANLRVADSSVMPTIVRAHPAATVIMIGEKVSDFIKKEYGI